MMAVMAPEEPVVRGESSPTPGGDVETIIDLREPSPARRARDEDFEDAFRELYPRAFALASRMLGNRQAAEDVASETMARALLRWDRLDRDGLPGWVLRVTANQAIDVMRRRGRRPRSEVIDLTDAGLAVAGPSRGNASGDAALRLTLSDALRHLPKRQREAIALRYLSDLSEADTAAALGISAGAVKAHVHRGLASLRERLGPDTLEAVGAGPE
jgi:RNA polymerase sigma factor (sigma-70 family)